MKKTAKRLFSIVISVMIVLSMLCVGFTANAATSYLIDYSKKASLTLYKYEMPDVSQATHAGTGEASDAEYLPESATPLADVTFTIYKVGNIEDYFKSTSVAIPTVDEAKAMVTSTTTKYSAKTDANGYCKMANLPLGIYLVEETDAPAQVTKPIAPFVLSLPMTNTKGDTWMYDVVSYPKNETAYGTVKVKKIDNATGKTLPNAEFTLYSSTDEGATWTSYLTGVKTGSDGIAVVDNLPSGTSYKFVETKTSDDSYILDSTVGYEFMVDGTGDIIVDSKVVTDRTIVVGNDTPTIEKYILDGEKGTEGIDNTANIGDTVYWKIKTSIPAVANKLKTYTITDTMSKGIAYKDAEIWLDDTKQLAENTDYTVSENGLTVTFTINPTAIAGYKEVEVYFNTTLTEEAPLATDIPNTSKLIYTNNVGTDSTYEKTSQTPTVHTGGYEFVKTNSKKEALEGAEFAIYASEEDANNGNNAITTAVSGSDGVVKFVGLAYGKFSVDADGKAVNGVDNGSTDYWIAETKAPNGFTPIGTPFKATINSTSHIPNNNPQVINNEIDTPKTGGVGTFMISFMGVILVCGGLTLLYVARRKKEKVNNK